MKRLLLTLLLLIPLPSIGIADSVTQLVETDWLKARLDNKDIVIIDMSDDIMYQRFHIPGAIYLPYRAINMADRKGISKSIGRQKLHQLLGLLGINNSSHVVIYDDMGGLNASRLYWELERIHHKKVSLLNGGLVKWILEDNKVVAAPVKPKAAQYKGSSQKKLDSLAELSDINTTGSDTSTLLLDVRSKEEYQGMPKHKRSGHVPGAKWWPWNNAVNFQAGFSMSQSDEIRKQLTSIGLTKPDQPVIVYCQTGHRASHAYFTLRRLGFKNVKLYDGSMAEYSNLPAKPLKKGMQP